MSKRKRTEQSSLSGLIADKPFLCCIIGRPSSGKSYLCRRLLLDFRGWRGKFDRIIFISPTWNDQYNSLWGVLSPEGIKVYDKLTDSLLQKIIDEQRSNEGNLLVIFDDVCQKLKHVSASLVDLFVSTHRHLRMSLCFLNQKISQLPTLVRSDCSIWCVFQAVSERELNALHNEVSIINKKDFLETFYRITQKKYGFIVLSQIDGKIEVRDGFSDRKEW